MRCAALVLHACTALHCTALRCTALHCCTALLHCTALHCTALHCTDAGKWQSSAGCGVRRCGIQAGCTKTTIGLIRSISPFTMHGTTCNRRHVRCSMRGAQSSGTTRGPSSSGELTGYTKTTMNLIRSISNLPDVKLSAREVARSVLAPLRCAALRDATRLARGCQSLGYAHSASHPAGRSQVLVGGCVPHARQCVLEPDPDDLPLRRRRAPHHRRCDVYCLDGPRSTPEP